MYYCALITICNRVVADAHRSRWIRGGFHISAADHGFCDGAQHIREDMMRPSSFDTAVVFLQNNSGATKWRVTPALIEGFKAAMGTDCPHTSVKDIQAYEAKIRGNACKD